MNRITPLILLLALGQDPAPQPVQPADPVCSVITGPDKIDAGRLVKLDGRKSTGEAYAWAAVGMAQGEYDISDDRRAVYFSTPDAGRYTFILSVAAVRGGKAEIDISTHVVEVIGDRLPGPKPPEPAPLTGLARGVADLCTTIPAEDRPKLLEFSRVFRAAAADESLDTPQKIHDSTRENNAKLGGPDAGQWRKVLWVPLSELILSEKPTTIERHREIWLQVAAGLLRGASQDGR